MQSRYFRVAKEQWQGRRAGQEDTCDFLPLGSGANGSTASDGGAERLLAVLADGMGGHVGGQRASSVACAAFIESFVSSSSSGQDIRTRLESASESSNASIAQETTHSPELKGMGCTLIGVHVEDEVVEWVSIGDSLLCLFRKSDGQIYRLNDDHSMAPVLRLAVAQGEMSDEEARQHPHRHALRSALTGGRISLRHADASLLAVGDCIVLASDGLLSLSSDEIKQQIQSNIGHGPQRVAKALIEAVKTKGRPDQDNTTVIAIDHVDGVLDSDSVTVRLPSMSEPLRPARIWALAGIALAALVLIAAGASYFNRQLVEKTAANPTESPKSDQNPAAGDPGSTPAKPQEPSKDVTNPESTAPPQSNNPKAGKGSK
jgi:PPM family protein phosphatase